LKKGSILDQATELLGQEKCDEAISLIENRFGSNPNDMKTKVCLAKAYLAKCQILKEKGDKYYKSMAFKPLNIGRSILHTADGQYICAHAFLINNRPERARKYVNKAIAMSPSPPADYYFVLGDSWVITSAMSTSRDTSAFNYGAKKAYEEVINMNISNDVKALAYYKLAVMYSESGYKEKAKKALESALGLAQREVLIQRIHAMLGIDTHQTTPQIQRESSFKLAIFPGQLNNSIIQWTSDKEITTIIEDALSKAIKSNQLFVPKFSYYELKNIRTEKIRDNILRKNDIDNLWLKESSPTSKEPNCDLICQIGDKLQVDAILTYYTYVYSDAHDKLGDFNFALINVRTKKNYSEKQTCSLKWGFDEKLNNLIKKLYISFEKGSIGNN
jgi:tetratricopeptide (TPR) repeat protein